MLNTFLRHLGWGGKDKERDGKQFWTSKRSEQPDITPMVEKTRSRKVRAARRLANHHRSVNR